MKKYYAFHLFLPISFHDNDTIMILLDSTVRPLPLPYSLRRHA